MFLWLIESNSEREVRHSQIYKKYDMQLDFLKKYFGNENIVATKIQSPYLAAWRDLERIYVFLSNPRGRDLFHNWFGSARYLHSEKEVPVEDHILGYEIDDIYPYAVLEKEVMDNVNDFLIRFPNMKFLDFKQFVRLEGTRETRIERRPTISFANSVDGVKSEYSPEQLKSLIEMKDIVNKN